MITEAKLKRVKIGKTIEVREDLNGIVFETATVMGAVTFGQGKWKRIAKPRKAGCFGLQCKAGDRVLWFNNVKPKVLPNASAHDPFRQGGLGGLGGLRILPAE